MVDFLTEWIFFSSLKCTAHILFPVLSFSFLRPNLLFCGIFFGGGRSFGLGRGQKWRLWLGCCPLSALNIGGDILGALPHSPCLLYFFRNEKKRTQKKLCSIHRREISRVLFCVCAGHFLGLFLKGFRGLFSCSVS